MTDQPNPYETSETETNGVLVGEAKRATSKRPVWFWLAMGCVVPLALIGLATLGFAAWVFVNFDELMGA